MGSRRTSLDDDHQEQSINHQPVASRTRRPSNTLTARNDPAVPAPESAGNGPMGDHLSSKSQGPNKMLTRHPKRRDYNELVNGQERVKNVKIKLVAKAYEKAEAARTMEEREILNDYSHLLPSAIVYLKRKSENQILKQRLLELEESPEIIKDKADSLAEMIKQSKSIVIYTGAGISTSASIPDYRGPNGLWTQIGKTGSFSMTKVFKDLAKAEPTFTHMAIGELCKRKIVKHVVSQNFDGLHLRSGVSQTQLSEIHGNMFIEICPTCHRQYHREADVTQKTVRFRHKTGRLCHTCPAPDNNLLDTIVLYGERSRSKMPMNWERASKAAKNADLIICMGTSLKTLRRYGCLWPKTITCSASTPSLAAKKCTISTASSCVSIGGSSTVLGQHHGGTKLVIVNLQHTSKDKNAVLKINAKCDLVMEHVMRQLEIEVPVYEISTDPLQKLAVPFNSEEVARLERDLIFGNSEGVLSLGEQQRRTKEKKPAKGTRADRVPQIEQKSARVCNEDSGQPNIQPEDDSGGSQKRVKVEAGICMPMERQTTHSSQPLEMVTTTSNKALNEHDDRYSPSLFVSELTADTDKRKLHMRIRALTPPDGLQS